MSRPLRIEFENAIYHVMNRGINHSTIFHDDVFYNYFLSCLAKTYQKFNLEILAYCLMSNHYHLLVKTPAANLSRCMRHIDGLYTQQYNRILERDGPLFRGRYKAILVDVEPYLLQVSRYIHRNPIETNPPLIKKIEDYRWSSYSAYINVRSGPNWLKRDEVLSIFNTENRYAEYEEYASLKNDQELVNFYSSKKTPSILGNKNFVATARRYQKNHSREITKYDYCSKQFISMDIIIERVASHFKIPREKLLQTKRGAKNKNTPRQIAIYFCRRMSGEKLISIANKFQVSHYTTINQTIRVLKNTLSKNDSIIKDINIISQDLTPLCEIN